jgi:hypothetical protein
MSIKKRNGPKCEQQSIQGLEVTRKDGTSHGGGEPPRKWPFKKSSQIASPGGAVFQGKEVYSGRKYICLVLGFLSKAWVPCGW